MSPEAAILELLEALVAVPSVNPPGAAYDAVQAVVTGWLERAGIPCRLVRVEGKPNVVAELGQGRPRVLFNGHVDVVPAQEQQGWTHPPFRLTRVDDRLFGRGTVDMKGSLAALLVALGALARRGLPGPGSVVVAVTVDEETGGHDGLGALVASGEVRADVAVVAEPTGLQVCPCGKGVLQQRIRVRGRAAHAAFPHLGVNAIEAAAHAVLALRGMPRAARHPLLGEPTLNVGTISGGTATNVVPDGCQFTVDRRLLPGETLDGVREAMGRSLEQARRRMAGADGRDGAAAGTAGDGLPAFAVEDLLVAEPFETDPGHPLVRAAVAAVREVLGKEPAVAGFAGFTDARFPAAAGIPTILLGPGETGQAHRADEHVTLTELVHGAAIFERLVEQLLRV